MKVYALGGKNNVSERHNELSEHKRSSSFPNLECEKTLALRGVEKFSRCVKFSGGLRNIPGVENYSVALTNFQGCCEIFRGC